MKKIKNADSLTHTWCGQEVQPGDYYTIQASELVTWANDSTLIVAITTEIAVVNDGEEDITDINTAINFLKGNLPTDVSVVSGFPMQSIEAAIKVAPVKSTGSSAFLVSHDFCDRTTWWGESVRVSNETLSTSDDLTFSSAHQWWIDLTHGKVPYEDNLSSIYAPVVKVDGNVVSMGFAVDYVAGTVVFESSQSGKTIFASYSYENGPGWIVAPAPGKVLRMLGIEIKVTDDVYFPEDQSVIFQFLYGSTPVGTVKYKNIKDLLKCSLGKYSHITDFCGLGCGMYVIPFDYTTSKDMVYSSNLKVKVSLGKHEPIPGTFVSCSANCISINEG